MGRNQLVFNSLSQFTNYFTKYSELEIPLGEKLKIDEYSKYLPIQPPITPNESTWLISVFNKAVHPLAKTMTIIPLKITTIAIADGNLAIDFAERTILKIERGNITTNLTDLFIQMLASSLFSFSLNSGQKLKISGIIEEEFFNNSRQEPGNYLTQTFINRIPPGLNLHVEGIGKMSWKRSVLPTDNRIKQNLTFKSLPASPIHIDIQENFTFMSAESFVNRINIGLNYAIRANETLTIQLPNLKKLVNELDLFQEGKYGVSDFVKFLGFLLIPFGKKILLDVETDYQWKLILTDKIIALQLDTPWVIRTTKPEILIINFKKLGSLLDYYNIPGFNITKNQQIIIPVKKNEYDSIKEEFCKKSRTKFLLDAPFGRCFLINFQQDSVPLTFSKYMNNDNSFYGIGLKTEVEMNFQLEFLSQKQLISIILEKSPQDLKTLLAERDSNAFIYLLFRLFIEYCHKHAGLYFLPSLPPYFKPSTSEKIEQLLEDKFFFQSWNAIQNTPEYLTRFQSILSLPIEEFIAVNRDDEIQSIQLVLTELSSIVYHELQNSFFFSENFIKNLNFD